jgi:biopolymer transport protein ExbB/TolQ
MDLSGHFVAFAQLGAGWVLWLLIGLSVVSVGVMIDRALWFRRRDTDTERFTRELRGAFERNEISRLETKYKDNPAISVQVAMRGLAERDRGPAAVAEAMHGERARWRTAADRNLIVLGTLGNNVPFIGLFGTVLGVINAFVGIATTGSGNLAAVAPGVAEALVATAAALSVAIPATFGYNILANRLNRLDNLLEGFGTTVIAMLVREGRI